MAHDAATGEGFLLSSVVTSVGPPSTLTVFTFRSWSSSSSSVQVAKSNPKKSIPLVVLQSAQGLAILMVARAGAPISYKLGTGFVVARRSTGSWSALSTIFSLVQIKVLRLKFAMESQR